jgi:mevalonate kinase
MRKTAAVLCAALLALTACGGDETSEPQAENTVSAEDTKAKENIKASVLDNATEVVGGASLTEEQAECFADGLVDDVGVEKLQEYKLIDENYEMSENAQPTNMSQEDAEATAAVVTGCVDVKGLVQDQINSDAGQQLTEEQAACITDAIDEEKVEAGLAATFQGLEGKENPLEDSMGDLLACVMGGSGGGGMELQ